MNRIELFFEGDTPSGVEGSPRRARAFLYRGYGGVEDGKEKLTSDCATFSELESQVEQLKSQLDRTLEEGKRHFSQTKMGKAK